MIDEIIKPKIKKAKKTTIKKPQEVLVKFDSPKRSKFLLIFKAFFVVIILAVCGLVIAKEFYLKKDFKPEIRKESCEDKNVAIINVHGDILTYKTEDDKDAVSSEDIMRQIEEADKNENIKAIILDVDSYGGSPVAGQEITSALSLVKKPTIALIRGAGDSAGYMVASAAKKVYANEFSEVGGIGITMSYLDYSKKNASQGVLFQQLSSGQYKDAANPNKPLTKEEKNMLLDYIGKLQQIFVSIVSQNRNLETVKVQAMADGSVMTAGEAKIDGLIDEIGTINDIKNYLEDTLKIQPEICGIQ